MIRVKLERKLHSTSGTQWVKVGEEVGDALLIFFGVWVLFHLVLFWIGGWIVIGEPSKPILTLETAGALGIIALGIDSWVSHRRAR